MFDTAGRIVLEQTSKGVSIGTIAIPASMTRWAKGVYLAVVTVRGVDGKVAKALTLNPSPVQRERVGHFVM